MIDVSQLVRFAARLNSPVEEAPWKAEWSSKLADEMRRNAPTRTGALRQSIQANRDGVGAGVRYAAFVEYGTAHTAPQPFLVPAVNQVAPRAAKDLGNRAIKQLT